MYAQTERSWEVLLIGGASGAGKSRLSYPLARRFGVTVTEVDDIHAALEATTTPAQQPALHFWGTHPDPGSLSPEAIMTQGLDVLAALRPALEAVVANHLESGTPVVLDGDFIAPALAAAEAFGGERNDGRVRALFVREPDEAHLLANFRARDPHVGPQELRARVSKLWDDWYAAECDRLGVPTISSRPWDTLLDRALAALG